MSGNLSINASEALGSQYKNMEEVRSKLANDALFAIAILGAPVVAATLFRSFEVGGHPVTLIQIGFYLVCLAAAVFHRRLSLNLRGSVVIVSAFLVATTGVFKWGLIGMGVPFFIMCSVVATIFYGTRIGILVTGAGLIIIAAVGSLLNAEFLRIDFDIQNFAVAKSSWISAGLTYGFFTAILVISLGRIYNFMTGSIENLTSRTLELHKVNENLENEIVKRREAEEAGRESEERFKLLFEYAPDAYYLIDDEGMFIDGNKMAEMLSGFERKDLIGKKFIDSGLLSEDQISKATEIFSKNIEGAPAGPQELTLTQKNGKKVFIEIRSYPINFEHKMMILGIARDVTERKQSEEKRKSLETQLMHSQKMEAIGTLAGGIAHDFNNILSAIIGYTELSKISLPEDKQLSNYFEEILKAGTRAKELVQQILTFSRQRELELMPVSVKVILKEALRLMRAALPSTIDIRQDLKSDSLIMGDPTQVHQIIMNLCTNAGQAMEEKGGTLEVDLRDLELDSDQAYQYPGLKPGLYINLTVSDTGCGMPPDILERIYDPFFTTKEQGEGTGMGLAVVHGIVNSYGGVIFASSEPGRGSSFKVFLPAIESDIEAEKAREEIMPRGKERILLIDDERALVELGQQMLSKLGYQVVSRTSSLEALELFRKQSQRFDLVITDMTMPQMTGDRLAKELMAIRRDIPIILCTGFSHRITEDRVKEMGIKRLLMKPLVSRDLAVAVRNVLDKK